MSAEQTLRDPRVDIGRLTVIHVGEILEWFDIPLARHDLLVQPVRIIEVVIF